MRAKTLIPVVSIFMFACPVYAGGVDGQAVLGGAIGGGAGAAIGSAVGGREGAIIGGAIGGAAGVAIATDGKSEPKTTSKQVVVEKEVVYVPVGRHDNGLHLGHGKNKHGRGRD